MTSITPITSTRVIIGVDTHKDLHVAVACPWPVFSLRWWP